MVVLLDALERAAIVARRPSEHDRRRNLVELTRSGRQLFVQAEQAALAVEAAFASALGDGGARQLRRALQTQVDSPVRDGLTPPH